MALVLMDINIFRDSAIFLVGRDPALLATSALTQRGR